MVPVRSVLVDFDGTACMHDVAEHLMERFGEPSWRDWDERWIRGEVDTRAAIRGLQQGLEKILRQFGK